MSWFVYSALCSQAKYHIRKTNWLLCCGILVCLAQKLTVWEKRGEVFSCQSKILVCDHFVSQIYWQLICGFGHHFIIFPWFVCFYCDWVATWRSVYCEHFWVCWGLEHRVGMGCYFLKIDWLHTALGRSTWLCVFSVEQRAASGTLLKRNVAQAKETRALSWTELSISKHRSLCQPGQTGKSQICVSGELCQTKGTIT